VDPGICRAFADFYESKCRKGEFPWILECDYSLWIRHVKRLLQYVQKAICHDKDCQGASAVEGAGSRKEYAAAFRRLDKDYMIHFQLVKLIIKTYLVVETQWSAIFTST
jgi:hypothetical protein